MDTVLVIYEVKHFSCFIVCPTAYKPHAHGGTEEEEEEGGLMAAYGCRVHGPFPSHSDIASHTGHDVSSRRQDREMGEKRGRDKGMILISFIKETHENIV